MRLIKSLKVLSLILLVNMTEGIVQARAGNGERQPEAGKPGPTRPDSLTGKRDDLDSTIVYTARDSLIYNFDRRTADLYGKAQVDYKDMRVVGPRITVDHVRKTVHSSASSDSLGRPMELPVYTDRNGSFTAEVMTYNYQTRKGLTTNVSSRDEEGFFTGYQVKRLPGGELYLRDGTYTTCDLEEPHYWFSGRNMKIVPGDRLVARPLVMYIHPEIFNRRLPKIPLLPLPFMSVPVSNKRASGFLFPRIGSDGKRGTYLGDIGYFWAFNDYSDLRLEGDYAFNGSWRLGERLRYKVGRSISGSIESEYETYLINHPDDPSFAEYKNWNTRIIHHQQFDPTTRLDVNLQYLGGDRYYDVNSINIENIITQQATSYASFSKSWAEGNRVFSLGYQRVDDLTATDLTQTVSGSLYQSQIYPFRKPTDDLTTDWRSRFYLQPSASLTGQFSHVDDVRSAIYSGNAGLEVGYQQNFAPGYRAIFTQGLSVQELYKTVTEQDDLSGTRIELPFKVQSTLFRYLTLNPSLTFTNYRVNSTVRKFYDGGEQSVLVSDPSSYSTAVFQVDAQTRLYGVMNTGFLENLVGLKAIRHTFIPTVSFIANPDYRGTGYDNYGSYINTATGSLVRYNRFGSSLYSEVPEERRFVGISLQNLFHGKFRNRNASQETGDDPSKGDRTVQLLSLTAATGYNFAADSLRFAPLTITATSNALAPAFQMTAGASYDFYSYDRATGARIDKLNTDDGGGLLRFLGGYLNMSVNVSGHLRSASALDEANARSPFRNGEKIEQAIFRDRYSNGELVEFSPLLPWSLRASLYLYSDKSNPLTPTTSALLNTSGRVGLSRHWQAGFNTGYDLKNHEFVYPALVLYRDLHDFQFSFQWVPSGEYRSYLLEIAMKPPQLKDLRYKSGVSY